MFFSLLAPIKVWVTGVSATGSTRFGEVTTQEKIAIYFYLSIASRSPHGCYVPGAYVGVCQLLYGSFKVLHATEALDGLVVKGRNTNSL